MTDSDLKYLARQIADTRRRLDAMERSARLQFATVGIAVDDTDDASVIDLDVTGALWTGVEASVDVMAAQATADAAARTFRQADPPTPASQPDGVIPEGSLWTDTDSQGLQFRWTRGAWVEQPLGEGALTPELVALITRRFPDADTRDALIAFPTEGMTSYLESTGLDYSYSAGEWVPLVQFIKKTANQSLASSTTLFDDFDLQVQLVPGQYRVEAFLHATGANSGGDIKIAWSYSGTVITGNRVARGIAVAATDNTAAASRSTGHFLTTAVSYGLESDTTAVTEDILLRVSTPGTLTLRWAQDTADATVTTVSAASRLYITKM